MQKLDGFLMLSGQYNEVFKSYNDFLLRCDRLIGCFCFLFSLTLCMSTRCDYATLGHAYN